MKKGLLWTNKGEVTYTSIENLLDRSVQKIWSYNSMIIRKTEENMETT